MAVTLGQQYDIGEKPTVILCTYINRHGGTPEKQRKNKIKNSTSNIVVIYCYLGGANPAVNTPWPSRGTRIESCDFIVLIGDP